jgi:hypothetical protein
MLITCQFEKLGHYEGEVYRVSATQPTGMNLPAVTAWPSHNMWKKFKERLISWEQFSDYYYDFMRQRQENFRTLAAAVVDRTIILCSWEPEHELSYRSLIARYLVNELGVAQELVQIH